MHLRNELLRFLWFGAAYVIRENRIPYTEIGRELFARLFTNEVLEDTQELCVRVRRGLLGDAA